MVKVLKKTYELFINRVFFLLAVTVLMGWLLIGGHKGFLNINLTVLNRLRPDSFDSLIKASMPTAKVQKDNIDEARRYYKKVAEIMPHLADAHGLYAYCSYYSGSKKEAIARYEKALKLNATFFWFYYNLGAIYYNDADYAKAQVYFQQALAQKPQASFYFISASQRLYLPLILSQVPAEQAQDLIKDQLTNGYAQAYKLLAESVYRQKNPQVSTSISTIPLALY